MTHKMLSLKPPLRAARGARRKSQQGSDGCTDPHDARRQSRARIRTPWVSHMMPKIQKAQTTISKPERSVKMAARFWDEELHFWLHIVDC